MNEPSRTALTSAGATARASAAGERAVQAARAQDAWDRLAALAFGGADSAGGCSEHAHDYECTCAGDGTELGAGSSVPPGDRRGVYADPEMETAD